LAICSLTTLGATELWPPRGAGRAIAAKFAGRRGKVCWDWLGANEDEDGKDSREECR